jgi:hypothetical protein
MQVINKNSITLNRLARLQTRYATIKGMTVKKLNRVKIAMVKLNALIAIAVVFKCCDL